jgi:hypothetical protein
MADRHRLERHLDLAAEGRAKLHLSIASGAPKAWQTAARIVVMDGPV